MSGLSPQKFWKLNGYFYPFYRFVIESYFSRCSYGKTLLMLDAGCGPHICSISKIPENITTIGLDINRDNIYSSHLKAKDKGSKNFHFMVASITSLPLKADIFDIFICVDVLEHLPNKHEAIAEILRVCKAGATFIGSTSNSLNPILLFDFFAPRSIVKTFTERFAPGHTRDTKD